MRGGRALTATGNGHTGKARRSRPLTCEWRTGLAWFRRPNDDQRIAWFGLRMENDMEWLTQNWIFVIGAIGLFWLMRRGGMGCGHGGGDHHRRTAHDGHDDQHRTHDDGGSPAQPPAQIMDPVSGQPIDPRTAVASVHRGAPVYFASRANRDRFETSPEDFPVSKSPTSGAQHHRRGGC